MKKKDRTAKQNRGNLSDEDMMLWHHLTRTLKPLHDRDKLIAPVPFDEPGYTPTPPADHAQHPEYQRSRPALGDQHHRQAPKHRPAAPPQLSRFDPRQARKIRAGRIEIEAKLDLHGMRQQEAHGALRTFLLRAHASRKKWVLVITGKGTFARDGDGFDGAGQGWDAPQRGILRRNVPMWLEEADLRSVVVSYTTAAVHHGGEGALYIQLRSSTLAK